jgi:8-oxo-dGTP pyrophosphatase MutT (NUDIX family)
MKMTYKRRHGAAIVDTEEGILVVSGRSKLFILPGGGARKGESREKAAIRELKEETGLVADNCVFLFEHVGSKHKSYEGGYFRNYSKVFLIKARGKAKPRHETKHVAYYKPESNIEISYNTKLMLDKYLNWKKHFPT